MKLLQYLYLWLNNISLFNICSNILINRGYKYKHKIQKDFSELFSDFGVNYIVYSIYKILVRKSLIISLRKSKGKPYIYLSPLMLLV